MYILCTYIVGMGVDKVYYIYTPGIQSVRGYIVFVFFVNIFVCLCVNFYLVKDFSATTAPRVFKFGTNIGYDLLYCVKET